MSFNLPPLEYPVNALAPYISGGTVALHQQIHRDYGDKMAQVLEGQPLAEEALEDVVLGSTGYACQLATEVWNHDLYWRSMSPAGGGQPPASVRALLERDFGSVEDFRQEFAVAAKGDFGSGWAWLVRSDRGLRVVSSSRTRNPLEEGWKALIALDVWEHAYYLDYSCRREDYIQAFLDHLINWQFLEQRLVESCDPHLAVSRHRATQFESAMRR